MEYLNDQMTISQTIVEKYDLKGKTLSPGFIDPHLHPSMAAFILTMDFITPFDWNFPFKKTKVRTDSIKINRPGYTGWNSEFCRSYFYFECEASKF